MDEKELSKLSYLIRALASSPEQYAKLLELVNKKDLIRPSPEFNQTLDALRSAFHEAFTAASKSSRHETIETAIQILKRKPSPQASMAAGSLERALGHL